MSVFADLQMEDLLYQAYSHENLETTKHPKEPFSLFTHGQLNALKKKIFAARDPGGGM